MLSKAELMALTLAALMQNPDMRAWVTDEARKPGSGGPVEIWSRLAREYADAIQSLSM